MCSPGGFVVVIFGSAAEEWCTLSHCPMGSAPWFPTRDEAKRYAASMPEAFEPHIIKVEKEPTQ